MWTRVEGVKKSEYFVDLLNGSSPSVPEAQGRFMADDIRAAAAGCQIVRLLFLPRSIFRLYSTQLGKPRYDVMRAKNVF